MNEHLTYSYEYEIRRGTTIVATGELRREQPLSAGDRFQLGAHHGLLPPTGRQPRLIVHIDDH